MDYHLNNNKKSLKMTGKFKDIQMDDDTKIISRQQIEFLGLDAVHEHWFRDDIYAESLIFVTDEIKDISDEQLEKELRASSLFNSERGVTISRHEGSFVMMNFNFETD